MATIKDVAAKAGVSISTVSRALNGASGVNPEYVARIKAAAQQLNYSPNSLGRNLRQQRQPVWTLIVTDIENPFLTSVARGVEDAAHASGYSVLLCNSDGEVDRETRYLEIAARNRVAGVLLTPASPHTDVARVVEYDIPVVAVDRPLTDGHGTDTVLVDTRSASCKAVASLIAAGRRRIGCITGPRDTFTAEERVAGYADALRQGGLPVDPSLIRYADFRVAGGHRAAEELLAEHVDALLVASNQMTIGAIQVMRQSGLTLGRDVDIALFDDAPWVELFQDSLTLVSQPAYELGHAAGRLILDRLTHGRRASQTVTLAASIIPKGPRPET
jgi:LacI family transcriptional regulator